MTSRTAVRAVRIVLSTARRRNKESRSDIQEILTVEPAPALLLPPRCSVEGPELLEIWSYARLQGLANAMIHEELFASDKAKPLK
jgi:hypothetical protein